MPFAGPGRQWPTDHPLSVQQVSRPALPGIFLPSRGLMHISDYSSDLIWGLDLAVCIIILLAITIVLSCLRPHFASKCSSYHPLTTFSLVIPRFPFAADLLVLTARATGRPQERREGPGRKKMCTKYPMPIAQFKATSLATGIGEWQRSAFDNLGRTRERERDSTPGSLGRSCSRWCLKKP